MYAKGRGGGRKEREVMMGMWLVRLLLLSVLPLWHLVERRRRTCSIQDGNGLERADLYIKKGMEAEAVSE